MNEFKHSLADEEQGKAFASLVAGSAEPPLTIYLRGDLGAGKTTFARAFIHALGFAGYVKSPSYGLLESYPLKTCSVLHLDLYRIEDPEELEYLALRDLFTERTVLLVEWPERGENMLPRPDLVMYFDESDESRFVICSGKSTQGQQLVMEIQQRL